MNKTQDTLRKIAEALGVVTAEVKEDAVVEKVTTEENIETKESVDVVEDVVAPVVEEKVAETTEIIEEAKEEVLEPKAVDKVEEPKEDPRVAEMQKQIEDLKAILTNALSQPEEETEVIPEVKEEPKGLTHSPEKPVASKNTGIGKKGNSIQSRVFKYINNN